MQGPSAKFTMAFCALPMQGDGTFGIFGILNISLVVAFQATFRNDPLFGFWLVALAAGDESFLVVGWMVVAIKAV